MNWHIIDSTIPRSVAELKEILIKNLQLPNPDDFFSPKNPLDISLAEVEIMEPS